MKQETVPQFHLDQDTEAFIAREAKRYETTRSAILPCLHYLQKHYDGWIRPEMVTALAGKLDVPEAWVNEVLYFYTMYNTEPVGRHHVQVCCTVSCAMMGARELVASLCQRYQVSEGQVTPDGKLSFSRVECLGSCGTAPMMQVGDQYYEDLNLDKAVAILEGLK